MKIKKLLWWLVFLISLYYSFMLIVDVSIRLFVLFFSIGYEGMPWDIFLGELLGRSLLLILSIFVLIWVFKKKLYKKGFLRTFLNKYILVKDKE